METKSNRRTFLKTTGAWAATMAALPGVAPAALSAKSPGQTLGVGCIGLGTRGGDLLKSLVYVPGVKVVAVCDVYQPHLQKGADRCANPDVKTYHDYRELLADRNVDVVVIATPDHWHLAMVLDAVKAGKDIYCEKGWAHTIQEAKLMRAAIQERGTVFQLGHQARASACALQAKELLAQGILGPVTLVRTGRYMYGDAAHVPWRWYGYYNIWERPDPAQVETKLDWKRWLGSTPQRPFNERHFWHWRCYWAYGSGQAGDLLSHELDFIQYLMGHGIPDTCSCAGLNAVLKDDREVPDTWEAAYQFEKLGRTVTFSGNLNTNLTQPVQICGQDALLQFDDFSHEVRSFTLTRGRYCQRQMPEGYDRAKAAAVPNHLVDFFNCVRSRSLPKCNADEAFVETATFLMSVESYKRGRPVRWDPVKEEIV